MNLVEFSLNNRVFVLTVTFVALGGGLLAFDSMSRLEDPEFTIKDALVITPYPGASASEVEQEVTDALELAVQQLGQIDMIGTAIETHRETIEKLGKTLQKITVVTTQAKRNSQVSTLNTQIRQLDAQIGMVSSELIAPDPMPDVPQQLLTTTNGHKLTPTQH